MSFLDSDGHLYSVSLNGPIINEVMFEATLVIKLFKNSTDLRIVWSVLELQVLAVLHVESKFFRIAMAKLLNRCVNLTLLDF